MDLAVIAFEGHRFDGQVIPALREPQQKKSVRIRDLAFVPKAPDSSVTVVELTGPGVAETLRQVTDAQFDLLSDEDLRTVSDALGDGSSALVVTCGNAWAARPAAAVRESEGELVMMERVLRDEVVEAIASLDDGS
ncbi:DUF6325 family protein [Streptomyces sp. NBC_01116]|uniref:hypothetical protein n=1 Tax=Streptomyces sp. NBC_01116 TaxID=2903752 RepID=UPI0032565267